MAANRPKKERKKVGKLNPRDQELSGIGLATAHRVLLRYHQHERLVAEAATEVKWPPKPGTSIAFHNHLGRTHLNELRGEVIPCIDGSMLDKASRRCRVQVHGLGPGVTVRVLPENIKTQDTSTSLTNNSAILDLPDLPTSDSIVLRSEIVAKSPAAASEPSSKSRGEIPKAWTSRRHTPCGEVYASIQASGAALDPHRLRHLGLKYLKDQAHDLHEVGKRPWLMRKTAYTKDAHDRCITACSRSRYVNPCDIPHEMGGHGPSLGNKEFKAQPHRAKSCTTTSAAKVTSQQKCTQATSDFDYYLSPVLHPKLRKLLPREMDDIEFDGELASDSLPPMEFTTIEQLARQAVWPGGSWHDLDTTASTEAPHLSGVGLISESLDSDYDADLLAWPDDFTSTPGSEGALWHGAGASPDSALSSSRVGNN